MIDNPHVGDKGEFWFASQLPRSWFWQPPRRDFGKDGIVVIRDGTDLHNLEFAVQVKTTARPNIRDGKVIHSGIQWSAIDYWIANPAPMLLVIVDLKAGSGWYSWYNDLSTPTRTSPRTHSKTVTVQIPVSNTLDEKGWMEVRGGIRQFYARLERAVAISNASHRLTPTVRSLIIAVRNLTSVANLPEPGSNPDLEPTLAIHEQVQHRNILVAVRSLVPSLKANSEAKNQLEAWIEAYEATAVLAYPSLRNLPDGDAIGPEFVVMVTSEIVGATRARLMTAGLDMIFSLLSGRVPISYALQGTAESTGTSSK